MHKQIPTQASTSISWKGKTHVSKRQCLEPNRFFPCCFHWNSALGCLSSHSPALAHIHTYSRTHTQARSKMTSRKQRCLRSFSSAFRAPSSIAFETMANTGAKNSLLHETVAQEILKIFIIHRLRSKNRVFHGTTTAQKVARFFRICHCAGDIRYLMMRRTIRNRIKCRMLAMLREFSTFWANETGIWNAQE